MEGLHNEFVSAERVERRVMNKIAQELPESERPYEKCLAKGADFLSDAELLAVILRTGRPGENVLELSRRILSLGSGNLLTLYESSIQQLMHIPGIGKVKAIQLKCIAELSKRIASTRRECHLVMTDARTVADYFMERLRHEDKEQLVLCMFDSKCHLIRDVTLSIGTVNASLVSPREIFLKALEYHAVHIILLHNHPSGFCAPSQQDIMVTKQVMTCGRMLGIELSDHIIIGDKQYFSFREQEMISFPKGEKNVK